MRYLTACLLLLMASLFACNDSASSQEETPGTSAAPAAGTAGRDTTSEKAAAPETGTNHGLTKMFFLHHSTGSGVVRSGGVRSHIKAYNKAHGTSFEFRDHGYEKDGLYGPDGAKTGMNYGPRTNNTNPPDLHALWTSDAADWTELRERILAEHEIISFKSCYPASNIKDAEELEYRKRIYLEMRDFFDTRPDKLFIVMTMPPLNPAATNSTKAALAREFSNWLAGPAYGDGHPNVACFDLFDALAQPDDGSPGANMLRADYRRKGEDSHPAEPGYKAAAVVMAEFFCEAAAAY